ncbi:hypothetical protein [uncultured Friedmanniella sp.]
MPSPDLAESAVLLVLGVSWPDRQAHLSVQELDTGRTAGCL